MDNGRLFNVRLIFGRQKPCGGTLGCFQLDQMALPFEGGRPVRQAGGQSGYCADGDAVSGARAAQAPKFRPP